MAPPLFEAVLLVMSLFEIVAVPVVV